MYRHIDEYGYIVSISAQLGRGYGVPAATRRLEGHHRRLGVGSKNESECECECSGGGGGGGSYNRARGEVHFGNAASTRRRRGRFGY